MENKPSFNRDLIIPIAVGGISIVGILAVLIIGRALNSAAQVPMTPSETPFEYIYLGTEPAITTPLVEGSEISTLPEDSIESTPVFAPPTLGVGSSVTPPFLPSLVVTNNAPPLILRTSTAGGLPTATRTQSTASVPYSYDDTSPQLAYTGNWVSQTNVSGAYQGTLHVSNTIGDTVSFTFTGREIHLFYQAGPSLGTIAITIDNVGPPPLTQAQNETEIKEWEYNLDTSGTHSIVIQHFGGGSINIDSLSAPGGTITPTVTFTPTQ